MKQISVLKLRYDVFWAPFDFWLARIAGGDWDREVHLYVGDRYWRLADLCEKRGSIETANRYRLRAEHHLLLGGWNDTPPAVAMAMEVPRPLTFTKAIGRRFREPPPDDTA